MIDLDYDGYLNVLYRIERSEVTLHSEVDLDYLLGGIVGVLRGKSHGLVLTNSHDFSQVRSFLVNCLDFIGRNGNRGHWSGHFVGIFVAH